MNLSIALWWAPLLWLNEDFHCLVLILNVPIVRVSNEGWFDLGTSIVHRWDATSTTPEPLATAHAYDTILRHCHNHKLFGGFQLTKPSIIYVRKTIYFFSSP